MANHRYKTTYGQCKCLWCDNYRSGLDCPVTEEMRSFLRGYATSRGRQWKMQLRLEWEENHKQPVDDRTTMIQQLRDVLGPTRLSKLPSWLVLGELGPKPRRHDLTRRQWHDRFDAQVGDRQD